MSEELKPCPFCGKHPVIKKAFNRIKDIRTHTGYYISCTTKNCIRLKDIIRVLDKAIFIWNTRQEQRTDK